MRCSCRHVAPCVVAGHVATWRTGYVPVSAHEILYRPDLSLFGFSVFRPPPASRVFAFGPFGFPAFRLPGFPASRLPGFPAFRGWGGKWSSLARPFNSDLKPCLTMGKPEVKLTFSLTDFSYVRCFCVDKRKFSFNLEQKIVNPLLKYIYSIFARLCLLAS